MCEGPLHLASAGEGLPGGEPLLLQHLAICQAGLQADIDAWPLQLAAKNRNGRRAAPGFSSLAAAVGTAGASAKAADSTISDGNVCSSLASRSQWAQRVSNTLVALATPLANDRGIADSTAEAIWLATRLLITHEIATRQPVPQPASVLPAADVAAPLCLRGPAAAACQHSLLRFLADNLTTQASGMAAAFLEPTADGAADSARCAVAEGSASRAGDAAPQMAADRTQKGAVTPGAELGLGTMQQQLTAAAARPDGRSTALLANAACCIVAIDGACQGSKELQLLLAPASATGEAWAKAIAHALGTAAECFGLDPSDMPPDARLFAFLAADSLSTAALELLPRFVAADLQDSQQQTGARLMRALAAHLASGRAVTAPCFEVRLWPWPAPYWLDLQLMPSCDRMCNQHAACPVANSDVQCSRLILTPWTPSAA